MSQILYLDCSPYTDQSYATQFIQRELKQSLSEDISIIKLSLSQHTLVAISSEYANCVTSTDTVQADAVQYSEALIHELEQADALIITTPMHNFTVPASLKLWIDYVLRKGRTFVSTDQGKVGLLNDRPVFILVRSAGPCQGEYAKQNDFLSPYLSYVLNTLGLYNIHFAYLSGLHISEEKYHELSIQFQQFLLR